MEQVIRNMNFKPILEKVEYERLSQPQQNSTINLRTWDEIKVERMRSDAVKVCLTRFIRPNPESLFRLEIKLGMEVLVNVTAYESLDDPEAFFRTSQVMQVLASHMVMLVSDITLLAPIGPIATVPMPMLPKE